MSPNYPLLDQINTRVWLAELSQKLGHSVTREDMLDADLDRLAAGRNRAGAVSNGKGTCMGCDGPQQSERKMNMVRAMQLFLGMAVLAFACAAEAQQPVVYPAKGQSMQQQSQDEVQCYTELAPRACAARHERLPRVRAPQAPRKHS